MDDFHSALAAYSKDQKTRVALLASREFHNLIQSIALAECKSSIFILYKIMLLQNTDFTPASCFI